MVPPADRKPPASLAHRRTSSTRCRVTRAAGCRGRCYVESACLECPSARTTRSARSAASERKRWRPRPRKTASCVSQQAAAVSRTATRPTAITPTSDAGQRLRGRGPDGPHEDVDLLDAGLPAQRLDGHVQAGRPREVDRRGQPVHLQPLQDLDDDGAAPRPVHGLPAQSPDLGQVVAGEGLQALQEHALLRREVVVDRGGGHVGRRGDVGDGDGLGRIGREEPDGGVDHGPTTGRAVSRSAWRVGHGGAGVPDYPSR